VKKNAHGGIQDGDDALISREHLAVAKEILKAVSQLRYGTVLVTVQDSKVVQIDKTEKIRLTNRDKGLGDVQHGSGEGI